jgi:hypothetical protein
MVRDGGTEDMFPVVPGINPNMPDGNVTAPTGGGTGVVVDPPPVVDQQTSAYNTFRDMLFSLAGLTAADENMIRDMFAAAQGYIANGVSLELIPDIMAGSPDEPDSYKNYVKNFLTIKQTRPEITTIKEWNDSRAAYKLLLEQYGLNNIATNETADQFLINGVSAREAASRMDAAYNAINFADEALKQQLKQYFPSLTPAELAASILGVGQTVGELQRKISVAGIRAEQQLAGFQSTLSAEDVAAQGVSRGQARQGFQQTALEAQSYTAAAQRAGISAVDLQKELESENVLGLASQRRKKIQQAEQNLFSGTSGTANVSLSRSPAGNF